MSRLSGDIEARELYLFTYNDGDLYRRMRSPIEQGLVKKKKRGTYDSTKAQKAYLNLVNEGAKEYIRQHGSRRDKWFEIFDMPTRRAAARQMAREFETSYKTGDFGRLGRSFCKEIVEPKRAFDPRSFRWLKRGKAKVLIGCPKGKWDARAERCKVGTRAHVVERPTKGSRCPRGQRRV